MSGKSRSRPVKKETVVTTAGRHPRENFAIVNPRVYHASLERGFAALARAA